MEKTPTKAGVDTADYLLTEESLIDYIKLFKFRTDTDYIPLLISAGFDSVVNLVGGVDDYVGIGVAKGHAIRIVNATSVIQNELRGVEAAPSREVPAPRESPSTAVGSSLDRRVAAGEPPEFPKCAKGKFPGRVAFNAWWVRIVAWVARWSPSLAKTLKTL